MQYQTVGGSTSHFASDDDLFVEGDVEVNGSFLMDGNVPTTVSGLTIRL